MATLGRSSTSLGVSRRWCDTCALGPVDQQTACETGVGTGWHLNFDHVSMTSVNDKCQWQVSQDFNVWCCCRCFSYQKQVHWRQIVCDKIVIKVVCNNRSPGSRKNADIGSWGFPPPIFHNLSSERLFFSFEGSRQCFLNENYSALTFFMPNLLCHPLQVFIANQHLVV